MFMISKRVVVLLALFGLIGLVLFSGCLQKLSSGSSSYVQDYSGGLSPVAISHPSQIEECRIGSCWCMVCKNGTNLFGPLQSLIGGYCYFEKDCTAQKTADLNNRTLNPDLTIRHFMLGQGPTFGDFAVANTYCTDRLSMAVQWLTATNDTDYLLPDASRAMCFLGKDIVPVYILYSNGTNIDLARSGRIGEILGTEGDDLFLGRLTSGPVGPVIVVTEMNFDRRHADQVASQVRAIDNQCGNDRANNKTYCLIAVAPRTDDYFGSLDAVMNALGSNRDKVDLVAYGIDGRYMQSCDGSRVRLQAINFSTYALYNWSKPSIIPYVLFQPGVNDSINSCTWTEADVVSAYGSFFPFGITTLQKRGVIGIAPYSFNTTVSLGITNPLNCTNCGVGQNDARLRAWYSGCQAYTNVTRLERSNPSASTQIIFGNESGTICNQNAQFDFMRGFSFSGRDLFQQQTTPLNTAAPLLFSCDACMLINASRNPNTLFTGLNASASTGTPPDLYCYGFPEINQWASARNIDPMFVRAVILTESGFNPCSAAKVCSRECLGGAGREDDCTDRCFGAGFNGDSECYSNAYDEMDDPSGNCTANLASAPDLTLPDGSINPRPSWRWCALGLMQSLEPPYHFWPSEYLPAGVRNDYSDVFDRSGFDDNPRFRSRLIDAKGCNPLFNPFNPSDSICVGTLRLEQSIIDARRWISRHRSQLNWPETDLDKDNLFTVYVASHYYGGTWAQDTRRSDYVGCLRGTPNGDCWISGFVMSNTVTEEFCRTATGDYRCRDGHPLQDPPFECYGYTDIIRYINECEIPFTARGVDGGKRKTEAYLYLLNGCENSMCPDGRRLFRAMERSLPSSGTPYLPDSMATGTGGS